MSDENMLKSIEELLDKKANESKKETDQLKEVINNIKNSKYFFLGKNFFSIILIFL